MCCNRACADGISTTIYNRWHRWSQQGLWQRMFDELSQIVGTHYENAIDSTTIKVHRSARGKKGPRPGPGHKPRRLHNQSPRGDRLQRPPFALSPERRPMLRWQSRRAFAEAFAPAKETVGRQGLRLCRVRKATLLNASLHALLGSSLKLAECRHNGLNVSEYRITRKLQ